MRARGGLLVLLLVSSLSAAYLAQRSYAQDYARVVVRAFAVRPREIYPGDRFTISVFIRNEGELKAYNVRAQLKIDPTRHPFAPLTPTVISIGNLDKKESAGFSYDLTVSEEAEGKPYVIPLVISYIDSGSGTTVSFTDHVSVEVKRATYSQIVVRDIEIAPSKVYPGDRLTLRATLHNKMSKVFNVQAQLKIGAADPLAPIGPTVVHVADKLERNETRDIEYRLLVTDDAKAGLYKLDLKVSYSDWEGKEGSVTESVPISIHDVENARPVVQRFESIPAVVRPGDGCTVKTVIRNVGNATAENVDVQLVIDPADPFDPLSPTFVSLGSLGPMEEDIVEYKLLASESAKGGTYSLNVRIQYEDRFDVRSSITESIPIDVRDITNAQPSVQRFSTDPPEVYPDGEFATRVTVKNVGEATARDVSVRLIVGPTDPFDPLSPTFISLGELRPGDSNEVEYWLTASSDARGGAYSLSVQISYIDRFGTLVSVTDSISIDVRDITNARPLVQRFDVDPPEVYPGDEVTVKMTIGNVGEATAGDVGVQLVIDPADPFNALSPTLVSLGPLGPGEEATVEYRLIAFSEAKGRPYPLGIQMSYSDRFGALANVVERVPVLVHGLMDFYLINLPAELVAEPGDVVALEGDLLLVGTESARFVEIRLVEQRLGPFRPTPMSSEYIGQVDPDSPVPFAIELLISPDASPGDYTAGIEITYWDEYNRVTRTAVEVPITVVGAARVEEGARGPTYSFWDLLRMIFGIRP